MGNDIDVSIITAEESASTNSLYKAISNKFAQKDRQAAYTKAISLMLNDFVQSIDGKMRVNNSSITITKGKRYKVFFTSRFYRNSIIHLEAAVYNVNTHRWDKSPDLQDHVYGLKNLISTAKKLFNELTKIKVVEKEDPASVWRKGDEKTYYLSNEGNEQIYAVMPAQPTNITFINMKGYNPKNNRLEDFSAKTVNPIAVFNLIYPGSLPSFSVAFNLETKKFAFIENNYLVSAPKKFDRFNDRFHLREHNLDIMMKLAQRYLDRVFS